MMRAEAEELLYLEALLLDQREWDAWLALYTPDCVFWVPAWADETTPTTDPERELSLIYYEGRRNLEDRVWRIRSGLSVASTPAPRTVHLVTNVLVEAADAAQARSSASFTVHLYDRRADRTHAFFGRYQHHFRMTPEGWRIERKQALLLNDRIPTVLDLYML